MEFKSTDAQTLEYSVISILAALGEDVSREGLIDTPKRVSKSLIELLGPRKEPKITLFSSNGYDQMIFDKGIEYYTFCEHHILPFFGEVKIGYIPRGHIIGLSKLSRIVEYFSKRLNTQEFFTQSIADFLEVHLDPKGLGVSVTGRHLCKEMRGARNKGKMVTTCLKGVFLSEDKVKREFLEQ